MNFYGTNRNPAKPRATDIFIAAVPGLGLHQWRQCCDCPFPLA
jgi:hypothetical protein